MCNVTSARLALKTWIPFENTKKLTWKSHSSAKYVIRDTEIVII